MESTTTAFLSSPNHIGKGKVVLPVKQQPSSSSSKLSHIQQRKKMSTINSSTAGLGGETNGRRRRDYDGKIVDENMIVLRMRIRETEMKETARYLPPSDWMEWEKTYYSQYYNEDVCEALGMLQCFLMDTRPSLALGTAAFVALSVPISSLTVLFNVLHISKSIFTLFHLN